MKGQGIRRHRRSCHRVPPEAIHASADQIAAAPPLKAAEAFWNTVGLAVAGDSSVLALALRCGDRRADHPILKLALLPLL